MATLLTQAEFERYAAAWARFLHRAARHPDRLQRLFTPAGTEGPAASYQSNVTFDVRSTITQLVSTVGIAGVVASFVLLPKADCEGVPRFRVVLYAVDGLGGRISAYFLGNAAWYTPPTDDRPGRLLGDHFALGHTSLRAAASGPVPYNLIRGWIHDWQDAAQGGQLNAQMFATHYGPLEGYRFDLSDFLNPLFTAGTFDAKLLQVNLGLKSYYPAFPDSPPCLTQTVGLVVRLFTPDPAANGSDFGDAITTVMYDKDGNVSGSGGGPSYDVGGTCPPS